MKEDRESGRRVEKGEGDRRRTDEVSESLRNPDKDGGGRRTDQTEEH